MSIDTDDEILQDFLVEAGELLELLSEQLVALEQNPEDSDLLNAVFRSFHTIKGGAGFLAINPLVDVCHRAEDVFNVLRQGERVADAELMDTILTVTDVVNTMFDSVRNGEDPEPADAALLTLLEGFSSADAGGASAAPMPEAPAGEESPVDVSVGGDEISDDEFEAMLDEIHGKGRSPTGSRADTGENESVGVAQTPAATAAVTPESVVEKRVETKPAVATAEVAKKPKKVTETTVRVGTARLDRIMNMVGELVLVRNRLQTLRSATGDDDVTKAVANLDVVTSDLQLTVMKTRMQPIKKVFGRFPRVVRDLARSLSKEIELELIGEETDLDKNLVEALADPLVHLVRNAVDHGIELPDDREKAGKSRQGHVILSAEQAGDHIVLSIKDDGKGMNADTLRGVAVNKGLMDADAAARLDDKECYNLIFAAGFSTKTQISDVSGRGVGMDVVKTSIVKMNGTVEIDSEFGKGSEILIKVPLTLAILPTLMVTLQSQIFALPLANVVEICNLDLTNTNVVDGKNVIVVRDKALPLFFLRDWLTQGGPPAEEETQGHIVIVRAGNEKVAFVVDQLIGQEEVVIKPLGSMLQGLAGLAGATITGDGRISLILDIPGLMSRYA
ncbi:MAG TPA: chemotaxis protein CheA [Chromatiaceae bacterium]|nr:chemotaxis protein CheA [Chromatiaceae bacterium]